MDLNLLGFDKHFEKEFEKYQGQDYIPCRVAVPNKTNYTLYSVQGELVGELSGKFFFENDDNKEAFPVVGDWVVTRVIADSSLSLIDHVLPRRTKFVRKAAGVKTEQQVIAANVDKIFIMTSVNEDINKRRIERYLTLIKENNIIPVIVFSKTDLIENKTAIMEDLKDILYDTEHHFISVVTGEGLNELRKHFTGANTIALIGSSGVGKSSLINVLIPGLSLKVSDISDYKDKGRHTTTKRELYIIPDGGLIIDNPGLRELQLWEGEDGLGESFPDIEKFVHECKFSDCRHDSEPGCAVKAAIGRGDISMDRYKSYIKLQREIEYFQRKQDIKSTLENKKKWKKITANAKEIVKHKYYRK